MKKVILGLSAVALLLATPSCKKGENDPTISFKTRAARLAGTYNIDSWVSSSESTDSENDKIAVTTSINGSAGTTITVSTPDGEDAVTQTKTIVVNSASFTIEKNGKWESVFNTTTSWTEEDGGWIIDRTDYVETATSIESGNWSFLGGESDEFKNKERVTFNVLDSKKTSKRDETVYYTDDSSDATEGFEEGDILTYSNGSNAMVYEIDMLKGKEMTLIQDLDNSDVSTTTTGGVTFSYSVVTVGETTIELSE